MAVILETLALFAQIKDIQIYTSAVLPLGAYMPKKFFIGSIKGLVQGVDWNIICNDWKLETVW